MNLSPIKKIVYNRTQERLSSELRITLQSNHKNCLFMGSSITEYAIRVANLSKVEEIVSDVYDSNLKSVEFNEEEEKEMQNWVKTIHSLFLKGWITGDLLL